jgi:glycosyltransferase involved in cell wall biosynthesis
MALALIESGGHDVHLVANKWTSFSDNYATFGHWLEMGQLHNLIKLHAPTTDIFHVHNEPSWFVTMIKETCDVPVVLDVHDSFLARTKPEDADENTVRITNEERNNFQLADALIYPSKSFGEIVSKEFKLDQPTEVVHSSVPRRLYRYSTQEWLGGLVYEGKVQVNTDNRVSKTFKYADYYELAKQCFDNELPFHLYAGKNDKDFVNKYTDIAIIHDSYHFTDLLREVAKHDWGLVGNIHHTQEWNVAMPNKLFEYIATSVPIVAMNAKECGEFVEKEGIGISVGSLEELMSRWTEHREIRKNLIKKRVKFSMENQISKLENIYRTVMTGDIVEKELIGVGDNGSY